MTDGSLDEWMDDAVPDTMTDHQGERVPAPQFEVDDLNKLDYSLRRLADIRKRVAERDAQAAVWTARVEAWREQSNRSDVARIERLEGLCVAFHRREFEAAIDAGLPEREWPKTITAPHGKLTSSAGRDTIEVDDESAVTEFLLEVGETASLKLGVRKTELKDRCTIVDKDDTRVLVLDGAVVPGVHVETGERTYKVKPLEDERIGDTAPTASDRPQSVTETLRAINDILTHEDDASIGRGE